MTLTLSRVRRATVACTVTASLLGAAAAAAGAVTVPVLSTTATSTETRHTSPAREEASPAHSRSREAGPSVGRQVVAPTRHRDDVRVTRAAGQS